jgi:hypothetical protein
LSALAVMVVVLLVADAVAGADGACSAANALAAASDRTAVMDNFFKMMVFMICSS